MACRPRDTPPEIRSGDHARRDRIRREKADARARLEQRTAKRETKSEQDRLAFGKPTAELEWDGIRKLDMPPPRWWVLTFWACFIFAVVWWVLYPSWPACRTYFPGPARVPISASLSRADR